MAEKSFEDKVAELLTKFQEPDGEFEEGMIQFGPPQDMAHVALHFLQDPTPGTLCSFLNSVKMHKWRDDNGRVQDHWHKWLSQWANVNKKNGLGMDAKALYRLGVCLENMRREDEALRLYHVVVENYAETSSARRARARIARAD